MKKSILFVGILLLTVSVSCRDEEGTEAARNLLNSSANKSFMKAGDSIPKADGGETEPPRKDQLQWKQCP